MTSIAEGDGGAGRSGSPFFFVHVQKTAGTSLAIRLTNQFRESEIYPDPTDGDLMTVMPQLNVDVLVERWAARRDQIKVVTGHFPLATADLLGGGFTTFTVLREPVERTLSYLRHFRKMTKAARKLSLEEIYEDPLRYEGLVHNHMVKMFSLGVDELGGGVMTPVEFTPDRLEQAKAGLRRVDVVGLQETFDDFVAELESRFGWDLGEEMYANHTDHVDVDAAFRARIAEDNAFDIEFYEYAVALVAERAERAARDTSLSER
jgi:Sulfotransferase family